MSALDTALEALCKAGDADLAEVKFVRIDTRRRVVQFVTARGVQRAQLDPPKAKAPAKKAAAKKTAAKKTAKRPAKKAAAKKAPKKSS